MNPIPLRCRVCGSETERRYPVACPTCGSVGTLADPRTSPLTLLRAEADESVRLRDVRAPAVTWLPTGVAGLDRVLGGGLPAGYLTILGGPEGCGKSTLALQAVTFIAAARPALLVSAEMDPVVVRRYARRLVRLIPGGLHTLREATVEAIEASVARRPVAVLVVDSLNRIHLDAVGGMPGSRRQLPACAAALTTLAHDSGCAVLAIVHLNSDNEVAGPRGIRYDADIVLRLDRESPPSPGRRLYTTKSRVAPSAGARLEMTPTGLVG